MGDRDGQVRKGDKDEEADRHDRVQTRKETMLNAHPVGARLEHALK